MYDVLFTNAGDYKKIIAALFGSKKGLTRLEIAKAAKLTPNRAFYEKLSDLKECGFILEVFNLTDKDRNNIYRLVDEYSLFYHQFIKGTKSIGRDYWHSLANTTKLHAWSGYAFENLCIRHINKITKALQIGGMVTKPSSFFTKATDGMVGAQIDILIDRVDKCINLIECKYYNRPFYLSKMEADKIKKCKAAFLHHGRTKKQVFITLLSLGTLLSNKNSIGLVDQVFDGDTFLE